jgi:hypothetical protein
MTTRTRIGYTLEIRIWNMNGNRIEDVVTFDSMSEVAQHISTRVKESGTWAFPPTGMLTCTNPAWSE